MGTFPSLFDHATINRYLPSTLGFDRMFDVLDHAADVVNNSNTAFPPVNVVRIDDNNYTVELAVAGYTNDEIELSVEKNVLTITGKKADKDERNYLVKGIAGRSFSRKFVLADTIVVGDASLNDGILTVQLENVIPESQKPRKISIK
jgi:molecular chaperone IbpA